MSINFFLEIIKKNFEKNALVWNNKNYSYKWLYSRYEYWNSIIIKKKINLKSVIAIEGDFSPNSIALLLSLIKHNIIIVPLSKNLSKFQKKEFLKVSQTEILFKLNLKDQAKIIKLSSKPNNKILLKLIKLKHPGLILFSSGSSGKNKAAVHDMNKLLEKFKIKRKSLRTITFLMYDHIGGINTLLYIISNGGLIVTVNDRNPEKVLKLIENYKVELLPTSPTFLNLLLLSKAYIKYKINSLKCITYGTEPMPENTLKRLNNLFPKIKFQQTYGLSEVGILRSKSESSNSLWVKIGGEGFKTRIKKKLLEIKADSAMLGYLNAPNPFTKDGWFKTGDEVVKKNGYIKILGRKSEIINVGGEKVYPQEIENVIIEDEQISDVMVYAEKNMIIGNIVCAKITVDKKVEDKKFINDLKKRCSKKLEHYKIPMKIEIEKDIKFNPRFKKNRSFKNI